MAKDFARSFYNSARWRQTRRAYKKSVGGLCERCLARGIVKPAEIVHHVKPLTPDNIGDPDISLSWDNLEAVCRECHEEIHDELGEGSHRKDKHKRFKVAKDGQIISKHSPR